MFGWLFTKVGSAKSTVRHTWSLCVDKQVSNIWFIMVHGLNEGHIAPYTDIEFQLTCIDKFHNMMYVQLEPKLNN